MLNIELKSGNGKIMWNDGCPKLNHIYVYTDTKLEKTIVFSGSDNTFFSLSSRDKYDNLLIQIKLLNATLRDKNPDGFKFYIRKASSQYININKYSLLDNINMNKLIIIELIKFIGIGY